MPFHTFCSAKFSTCIAVRLLKFSVLHGKGESKYRPVATNFQCLKMFCHMVCHLLGSAFPKPCSSLRWFQRKSGVSHYIALSIPERAFIIFTVGRYMAEMKSPNVHAKKNRMTRRENERHTSSKSRVTAEEKLRNRIRLQRTPPHPIRTRPPRLYGVNVKHTVVVAQGGEDALAALAALSAQCSKIGSNLNHLHGTSLRRQRHRAAPGANTGGTVRTHELSAESRRNGW